MGLEAGTVRTLAAFLVGCLLVNSISGYNMPRPPSPQMATLPCTFEVTQGGSNHAVEPVERAQTVSSFYNYFSDSAHTPFVEAYASVLYLYLDTGSSKLYFVFHFNVDGSGSPDGQADVELQGIPAGAAVAVSDDPGEFNLARNPQGQFHYFTNTDGGALGPLPTSSEWTMKVDLTHYGPDPARYQRWVDSDGTHVPLSMTGQVTIGSACNKPPVANGGGPYIGTEGSPILFNASGSYDPDGDALTYSWDFENDGTTDITTMNATVSHIYPDDFKGRAKLTVSDGKLQNSTTVDVGVMNVSPSITFDSVTESSEGGAITLQFSITDPGADPVNITVDWGDGLPPEFIGTWFNPSGQTVTATRTYGDDGSFPLEVTATDDDGGVGMLEGKFAIVQNLPPTIIALSFPATADEGSHVDMTATAQDAGSDDLRFTVDFGNGEVGSRVFYNDGAGPDPPQSPLGTYPFAATFTFTAFYPQDGDYAGELTVQDDDGGGLQVAFSIHIQNVPPTIIPFGPVYVDEGSPGSITATATDPGNDSLSFHWEFELGPTLDETFPATGSPMSATSTADFLYGDDGNYTVLLTVTDENGASAVYETAVIVRNVAPTARIVQVNRPGMFTLRVAGEKWHDVEGIFFINDTVLGDLRIVRMPGSPDDQAMSTNVTDLFLSANCSARIVYTPEDDPINGQPNGANPVWIMVGSPGEEPIRIHHTFNVNHPGTYVWEVDLTPYVARLAVHFKAVAVDPGSDDLTFEWDFGDNSTIQNSTAFNDGVGPDPPESPGGTFPFTATAEVGHAFANPGTYVVRLTVHDDDGGSSTTSMTIAILG